MLCSGGYDKAGTFNQFGEDASGKTTILGRSSIGPNEYLKGIWQRPTPTYRNFRLGRSVLCTLVAIATWGGTTACQQDENNLLIFAAASLTEVLQPLGESFGIANDLQVHFSFAGSTSLAQQVVRGAQPDLFFSSGPDPILKLNNLKLLTPNETRDVLTNNLVLITSDKDGNEFDGMPDLLIGQINLLAIADPRLAPAGKYARDLLRNLEVWDGIQQNLIYGQDVRTVLAYVESGNVDAGIVYQTDATNRHSIKTYPFVGGNIQPEIVYPIAILRSSENELMATAFIEFLTSESSQNIFREFGFIPLE